MHTYLYNFPLCCPLSLRRGDTRVAFGETFFETFGFLQLELSSVVAFRRHELVHFSLVSHQSFQHLHRLVEYHLLFLVTLLMCLDLGQRLLPEVM